jgi:hypothetical protein
VLIAEARKSSGHTGRLNSCEFSYHRQRPSKVHARHGGDIGTPHCNLWKSVPIPATLALGQIDLTTWRISLINFSV